MSGDYGHLISPAMPYVGVGAGAAGAGRSGMDIQHHQHQPAVSEVVQLFVPNAVVGALIGPKVNRPIL